MIIVTDLDWIINRVSIRMITVVIIITKMFLNRNLLKEIISKITVIEIYRHQWDPKVIWSRLKKKKKMMILKMSEDYMIEDKELMSRMLVCHHNPDKTINIIINIITREHLME